MTGACHAPVAVRQGKALAVIPSRPPSPSENPQILRWMRAAIMSKFMLRGSGRTRRILRLRVVPCKPKKTVGFRRSRIPPRRAHDTLQPQDESIIVGYYTSAEVLFQKPLVLRNLKSGGKSPWQEATVSIVPTQEICG